MPFSLLRTYPRTDARFRRDATQMIEALGDDPSAAGLQRALRAWYPRCVVRPQAELARLGLQPVWYLFRDGAMQDNGARADRLYAALARSRDLIASTLATVDRSAELGGGDPARSRGRAQALHHRFDAGVNPDAAVSRGEADGHPIG